MTLILSGDEELFVTVYTIYIYCTLLYSSNSFFPLIVPAAISLTGVQCYGCGVVVGGRFDSLYDA